jgi:hypothetical protein
MASEMRSIVARLPALVLVAAAAAAWYAARDLEVWSLDGPGAGLLPKVAIGLVAAIGALVALRPPAAPPASEPAASEPAGSEAAAQGSRATLAVYLAGLAAFAVALPHLGFVMPALAVTAGVLRFAEGRSWTVSVLYAVLLAAALVLLFGTALGVRFPDGPIEALLMRIGVL